MIEKTTFNRCVYIQNHQTELDWLFMCYFLQMFGEERHFVRSFSLLLLFF